MGRSEEMTDGVFKVGVGKEDGPVTIHRAYLRGAFLARPYQAPFVVVDRSDAAVKAQHIKALEAILQQGNFQSMDEEGSLKKHHAWKGGYLAWRRYSGLKSYRVILEGLPWDPRVVAMRNYLDALKYSPRRSRELRTPRLSFLVQTPEGLRVLEREVSWGPLERDNYEPDVLDAYDKLLHLFTEEQDNGRGRLAILAGPPGTGKTYLLKGLCYALASKRRAPILLSPDVVGQIGTPAFLAWFLSLAQANEGPIRLLVEDADHLLLRRDDNPHGLSALSNLLQVTSGMLGEALDVRIVCTINEWDESRIDPAIMRPGRLAIKAEVGLLSPFKAAAVAKRLGKAAAFSMGRPIGLPTWTPTNGRSPSDGWTLAEVYGAGSAWEPRG